MRKVLIGSWLLSLLFCIPILAQDASVTGRVTASDDGSALPGVSVVVKGTSRGTTTDANGDYRINAVGTNELTFSFVGYTTQTVAVGNRSTINLALTADASTLNEVVVTALGVARQQKELGSATDVVKADKLIQARAVNVTQALSGKVAGLQINTVGNGVNPQTRVVLRGNRSLLGNNQALVVIDGTQVPQDAINFLNPNDIETVTILKGANAAALYGSEASNGALVITTKKGSAGAPRVTVQNTTNFESISFLPKFNERFGGGTEAYSRVYVPFENQSYGPEFDGSEVVLGQTLEDGTIQKGTYSAAKNAKRDAFNTGSTIQNDISLSSGDERGTFYISLQDVTTKGIVPDDKYRRTGGRFNATRTYGKFKGGFNVDYRVGNFDGTAAGAYTNATGGSNTLRNANGFYYSILNQSANIKVRDYANWQPLRLEGGQLNPANPNNFYNDYYDNPYFEKDIYRQNRRDNYLTGNFELQFQATPWLNFLYRAGIANQGYQSKITGAKYTYGGFAKQHISRAKDIPGQVIDYDVNLNRLNQDFFLTAKRNLGPISANLILGTNVQERRGKLISTVATSLVQPGLYNVSNRVGEPSVVEQNATARLLGVYGDLTLGFKDYLFLHLSGRNDWSSVLAKESRSFFYPGVDVSFVVTDAIPALKNNNVINSAKIRAAATRVGQINITGTPFGFGAYGLQTTFNPGFGFPYGGQAGYTIGNTARNPDLKPEFVTSYEVGGEFSLLNDRVTLDLSYYTQQVTNQTVEIDVSSASGFSRASINTGRLDNSGFEIDLKGTPVRLSNGFRWDVGINYSKISSKVIDIYGGDAEDALKEINLTSYYALGTAASLNQVVAERGQQFPLAKAVAYERDPDGRVVVDPTSGYPLKAAALKTMGQTNPTDRLGINTTLKFKGFTLAGLAEFRGGYVIAHGLAETMWFTGAAYATTVYGRERFIFPNSVIRNADGTYTPNTSVAVRDGGLGAWDSNLRTFGENFVTSGAFWKLRELALTYQLPTALLNRTKAFKTASIGVVGRNLLTLLPKENIYTDPEFANTTGNAVGVNATYTTPPTRTYGFTVQLGF